MFAVMMPRLFVSCAALALLAACGSDPAPAPADDGRQGAEGEVLGGTISDDMLPLDTLRSQSPPQSAAATGAGETSDTAQATVADESEAEPDQSGEPAETAAADAADQTEE